MLEIPKKSLTDQGRDSKVYLRSQSFLTLTVDPISPDRDTSRVEEPCLLFARRRLEGYLLYGEGVPCYRRLNQMSTRQKRTENVKRMLPSGHS
jgi:hypothetical protein